MGIRPGLSTGSSKAAVMGLSLAGLTIGAVARGQLASTELEWNAPAECPSRQAVLEEVARVLGHPAAGPGARASANVSRDERGHWHAALSIEARGATGQRQLEAETCPAIASAAAVIVAVAIERGLPPEPPPASAPAPALGSALAPGPAPAPVPAPLPTPAPAPTPALTRPTAPKQASTPPESRLLLGAGAVGDAATMPTLAGGVEASVGWMVSPRPLRLRILATGVYFPYASHFVSATVGADFDLWGAAGRACAALAAGAFGVGPCIGAEFDSMRAFNVEGPGRTDGRAEWWSLLGSALAELQISRLLALTARADVLVVLPPQPAFVVRSAPGSTQPVDTTVHRPYAVPIRGVLGVEMHFF